MNIVECRSRLGFCGTGIVYCNSASSWIPSCGGGGGTSIQLEKGKPTPYPTTTWEAWVGKVDDAEVSPGNTSFTTGTTNNTSQVQEGQEEEGKEEGSAEFNPDVWANWDSAGQAEDIKEEEDLRWWKSVELNSSTMLPVGDISRVLFFTTMAFAYVALL